MKNRREIITNTYGTDTLFTHMFNNKIRKVTDTVHNEPIYHSVRNLDYKIRNYKRGLFTNVEEEYLNYIGKKIGEEYSEDLIGEEKELVEFFAMLEVRGKIGKYINPYNSYTITNGKDNPKSLLQLECVNGITIKDDEKINEFFSNTPIYVATYEIQKWEYKLNKNIYVPIKEYYVKDEKGKMNLIGTGTDEKTEIVINNSRAIVENNKILTGMSENIIIQEEIAGNIIKKDMEKAKKGLQLNGKITEISEITNQEFLKKFARYCGINPNINLEGKVYIVTTVEKNGKENYDIVVRNDGREKFEYGRINGLKRKEKLDQYIYILGGNENEEDSQFIDLTQILVKYKSKLGPEYFIVRDTEGRIELAEGANKQEQENKINAKYIEAKQLLLESFTEAYQKNEIRQSELDRGYRLIKNTEKER